MSECQETDFLKLDTQGAELLVLAGAQATLQNALVVQTEVEFVPLYKRQPLFADIDSYLRARGFAFHRLSFVQGRTFKPMVHNNDIHASMSQMLWGDAIYIRDFMRFDELTSAQLLKLAAILNANYQSIDLAALALKSYDRIERTDVFYKYLEAVATKSPPNA
ncbi:MAG: FkbM family methyltransferase [Verrucomicrobia bacterium]|nr:FkbM family methyltransferase [Verrucomicrobiota bacterium]